MIDLRCKLSFFENIIILIKNCKNGGRPDCFVKIGPYRTAAVRQAPTIVPIEQWEFDRALYIALPSRPTGVIFGGGGEDHIAAAIAGALSPSCERRCVARRGGDGQEGMEGAGESTDGGGGMKF